MTGSTDRIIAHLREHAAPTIDLGRFFRATSPVRLDLSEADPAVVLDKLAAITELRHCLGEEAGHGAVAARTLGASWSQIGNALCISRQAAHQHWVRVAALAGGDQSDHGREEP